MSEVKLSEEVQAIFDKMNNEMKVNNIIRDNDALVNALSAMYYMNKFNKSLEEIGINLFESDFQDGLIWLEETIKSELIDEFDNIPEEYFESDSYLDVLYGKYLTEGEFIIEVARYVNWALEKIG